MKKAVVFLEVEGGNDKCRDGHRKDTMPMVNAVRDRGWEAEVVYYTNDRRVELTETLSNRFDAYISRINPGHIPGGEAVYLEFLRELSHAGMLGLPTADAMIAFGAKDALVKLTEFEMVPDDTYAYYDMESFRKKFPRVLSTGVRVLKQNRGSTGSGIWRVEPSGHQKVVPGEALPESTLVRCTEAVDNHVEEKPLGEFMRYCDQYLGGHGGMIVDMRYFPRIVEGEVRILFVGSKPVFVVDKKPAEGGFSATLFSGAQYTYDPPEKWQHLVDLFLSELPYIRDRLGGHPTPLIWTADFMLDTKPDGSDRYVLGEINCSCVGFTSHLDMGIQDTVAEEIIRVVREQRGEHDATGLPAIAGESK